MKQSSKIKQPTIEDQQELLSIDQDGYTVVEIRKSKDKYKIGWQKPYTTNRYSAEYLKAEVPKEVSDLQGIGKYTRVKYVLAYKLASYVILNNFWKIKFFHWFYWRYLLYVKQYDNDQLLDIIIEGKKKMTASSYCAIMGYASLTLETTMRMTKQEAEQWRVELLQAYGVPSEKSILGQ